MNSDSSVFGGITYEPKQPGYKDTDYVDKDSLISCVDDFVVNHQWKLGEV